VTPDRDEHRKTMAARNSAVPSVIRAEYTYDHDVSVSIILFVLMIAIAARVPISSEIADDSVHRHGFLMYASDLIVNFGLSIGMSLLLFSSRPRRGRDGAGR
jgi:predicted alternative tryptophan synthase beta-subunit